MTSAPAATTNPRHRKFAATILAFFALQFAFVTAGNAVGSGAEIDAGIIASSEATNSVDPAPAGTPTASSEGAEVVRDEGSAPVDDAVAQRPPLEIPYYEHPFLPDECFWYCTERKCPCHRTIIFP